MKKHLAFILIILSLGVFSWAQGSKDLFDEKKSQTELEIMKGILSTTISHGAQNYRKNACALQCLQYQRLLPCRPGSRVCDTDFQPSPLESGRLLR